MSGVTTKIRQKLEFHDEAKWKEFSARRLRLIEDNHLYSRKASDQDVEVKKTARILQSEFRIPEAYLDDVDRLVRAAIQSIRRNRKRSMKGLRVRPYKAPMASAAPSLAHSDPRSLTHPDTRSLSSGASTPLSQNPHHDSFMRDILIDNSESELESTHSNSNSPIERNYSTQRQVSPRDIQRQTISLLHHSEPNYSNSYSSSLQSINNSQIIASGQSRLLDMIRSSLSANRLTSLAECPVEVLDLGKNTVSAAVCNFVCHTVSGSTAAYLLHELQTKDTSLKLLKIIDQSPDTRQMDVETGFNTLNQLIGSCVLDFGMDSIIKSIGCLLLEVVQFYPSVKLERQFPPATKSYIPVEIRFRTQKLSLQFDRFSRAMPSVCEVIRNCKKGFQIAGSESRALTLRSVADNMAILNTDSELQNLLNKNHKVELELCYLNDSRPELSLKLPSLSSIHVDTTLPSPPPSTAPLTASPYSLTPSYGRISHTISSQRSTLDARPGAYVTPKFERLL